MRTYVTNIFVESNVLVIGTYFMYMYFIFVIIIVILLLHE